MPFNGDGTFTPISPEYPAIADTVILASDWNTILEDIATAFGNTLTLDGQSTMLANLPMGSKKITGLANGTAATDAMALGQLGAAITALTSGALTGGVWTANTPALGTNTTQLATTAFVQAATLDAALPDDTGAAGKFLTTNGSDVFSWGTPTAELPSQAGEDGKFLTTAAGAAAWAALTKTTVGLDNVDNTSDTTKNAAAVTLTNKTVEAGVFTNGYTEEAYTANTGAAYTIDLANGSFQVLTLTANCTFTFPTATAGKGFTLILKQDGTGSRTATWDAAVAWPGAAAPTITSTASKADKYVFAADGTKWIGSNAGQNYTL